MNESWFVALAVAAGAALLWTLVHLAWRRRVRTSQWQPEELGEAGLAYVERTFRSDGLRSIVARVDRAYRSPQGLITLVELKTRREDRVYLSDIIELSSQRLALSSETGERVASVAFVVVESKGRRRPWRVKLMSTGEVLVLAQRREDLLNGVIAPRGASRPGLCAACAYRARCHPEPLRDARQPHKSACSAD
mmetsp:Transcript_76674/g.212412  ORF Transcript_76674/g.212412 Transcript_76674/m.212412 type:complete len:193 (+) Transcript_76674:499-1077(+)